MSDDDDRLNEIVRRMERKLGRRLSTEEYALLEKMKAAAKRAIAEMEQTVLGQNALLDFMLKLISRQGTITPDFDALYKKRGELDRKFLDP